LDYDVKITANAPDGYTNGLACMERNARTLSEIHAKADLTNTVKLKTASWAIWNDLPQEFIDKTIVAFCNGLRSRVAEAVGHSEHCVAADIHH